MSAQTDAIQNSLIHTFKIEYLKDLVGGYLPGRCDDSPRREVFTSFHPKSQLTNDELVGGYWPGVHLFPSRTEKLSPEPPMILGSNLVK